MKNKLTANPACTAVYSALLALNCGEIALQRRRPMTVLIVRIVARIIIVVILILIGAIVPNQTSGPQACIALPPVPTTLGAKVKNP